MASRTATLRSLLSATGMLRLARCRFAQIPDPRRSASVRFSLGDTLMAALAMFQFKSPSLLHFDQLIHGDERTTVTGNLKRLFRLGAPPPSDTQMRTILDRVSPDALRGAFRAVHSAIQRGRMLEDFKVLGDRVLVSIDGTALFGSTTVHCKHCGVVKHSNGATRYYHQLLAAVVCSPAHKTVLPIDFEPIIKSDGDAKDCCEANAAARLIPSLHRQYPKLSKRFIVNEDALSANGPHVKLLAEHGMDFIIVAKPGAMTSLFRDFDARQAAPGSDVVEFEQTDDTGTIRGVRFANALSINDSHPDTVVNLLEFWEVTHPGSEKEKTTNWSWITSLEITSDNALEIAACGRARWHIENQTFNTLKNQGYHFEHNYGHGKRYLSSTLAGLMLLSFLIDQVQEHACPLFRAARKRKRIKTSLWAAMLTYLHEVEIPDWATLWSTIGGLGPKLTIRLAPDTG